MTTKLHETLLEILDVVDSICKKHNIQYFLDSGTALGAYRHHGFIPWDDDIDIGMLYDDYVRFLKIATQELPKDYFLQDTSTEKECPYIFAKVRKNGTLYMEWCNRNLDINHGVYIDVFPYYKTPRDFKERKKFLRAMEWIGRFFYIRTSPDRDKRYDGSIRWFIIAFFRRGLHYLSCLIPRSIMIEFITKYSRKYNDVVDGLFSPYYKSLTIPSQYVCFEKSDLLPVKTLAFENRCYPVPNKIELYLECVYGNYMQMPPEKERVGHLPYKATY
ncbi:MAG: LicD family protein [Synergistaceae bacterium]